jgi:hypothetical protein
MPCACRGLFRKSAATSEMNSTLILATPLFIILSRILWNERKYISYKYQQNVDFILAVSQGDSHKRGSLNTFVTTSNKKQSILVVIQLNVYEMCLCGGGGYSELNLC